MFAKLIKSFLVVIICLIAEACAGDANYAPVADLNSYKAVPANRKLIYPVPLPKKISTVKKNIKTNKYAWIWPMQGKVVQGFSQENKGLNIAGAENQPIFASANGVVVYSGDGLRSYGNLIIIKHNQSYFSAYAHNKKSLVQMGDAVRQGQVIGVLGSNPQLHFEIRKAGQPVDPITLLQG